MIEVKDIVKVAKIIKLNKDDDSIFKYLNQKGEVFSKSKYKDKFYYGIKFYEQNLPHGNMPLYFTHEELEKVASK